MTGKELVEKMYEWKRAGLTLEQVKPLFFMEIAKDSHTQRKEKASAEN
jgi:hypothetical protein